MFLAGGEEGAPDVSEQIEEVSEETGTSEQEQTSGAEEVSASAEETSTEDSTSSEQSSEEWFVPGRFKTAADMRKSYEHLESAYGRQSNEIHRLRTQTMKPPRDPEAEIKNFAEAVKRNPVEAVRTIVSSEVEDLRQATQQAKMQAEYNRLSQNKEFVELEPVMSQLAIQMDDMITDNNLRDDPRLLNALFLMAKGIKKEEEAKKAEKRGIQKGEKSALKKAKAQVEGASGTKGHVKRSFDELSLEEMEKELRKGNL